MLHEFWNNFEHNLFKPLLLFFYMGFTIPLLGVPFEFPHVLYQGLTMYLLVAIGWRGGEELAELSAAGVQQALGFMVIGFILNFIIGCLAYFILRAATRLRRIDAATVAGYYGSDSAGTFVTCVGVLGVAHIAYAAYMPVMLAVMEIPGCLVALFLVSRLRQKGMDAQGNMPGEPAYDPTRRRPGPDEDDSNHVATRRSVRHRHVDYGDRDNNGGGVAVRPKVAMAAVASSSRQYVTVEEDEEEGSLEEKKRVKKLISWELIHEVFFNPGLYLLFGGIAIGCVSRLQGANITKDDDLLFVGLFNGALCLFLLEMGMTASKRLRDLRAAGWRFVVFALAVPNIFATIGIVVAHGYSMAIGQPFQLGTYVLFSVLCAAASYIAVPAVQRLAIPEASPTLPLAASLGCTFSYNVTVGIPVYIVIAKTITAAFPVT